MTIDYQDLLKRYMWLVYCAESLTFVIDAKHPNAPWLKFTPEEVAELEAIEKRGMSEFNHLSDVYYGRTKA